MGLIRKAIKTHGITGKCLVRFSVLDLILNRVAEAHKMASFCVRIAKKNIRKVKKREKKTMKQVEALGCACSAGTRFETSTYSMNS